jgi:hypothetical protein
MYLRCATNLDGYVVHPSIECLSASSRCSWYNHVQFRYISENHPKSLHTMLNKAMTANLLPNTASNAAILVSHERGVGP